MIHMLPWLALALYFLAINFIAYTAFGIDKDRARGSRWRIAEKDLLLLAVIGGTIGAYLGRSRFRHKTRKPEFSIMSFVISFSAINCSNVP